MIPDSAFRLCSSLENVALPEFCTTVAANAFAEDTKLVGVYIPETVESIQNNSFSYPARMTIFGTVGSYAQKYANSRNIKFEAYKVSEVDFPADMVVTVEERRKPNLPNLIYAVIQNSIRIPVEVEWDFSVLSTPGEYTVIGTVEKCDYLITATVIVEHSTLEGGLMLELTFDDTASGFAGGIGKAKPSKIPTLVAGIKGRALRLDGSQWLNVADELGDSLLYGLDEMTVAYYSKKDNNSNVNWSFYAAPDSSAQ